MRVGSGTSSVNLEIRSMVAGNRNGLLNNEIRTTHKPPTIPPTTPGTNCDFRAVKVLPPAASASAAGADRPTLGASTTPIKTATLRINVGWTRLRSFNAGVMVGMSVVVPGINATIAVRSSRRKDTTPISPRKNRMKNNRVLVGRLMLKLLSRTCRVHLRPRYHRRERPAIGREFIKRRMLVKPKMEPELWLIN